MTHTEDDTIMAFRLSVCVFVSTATQKTSSLVVGVVRISVQFQSFRIILSLHLPQTGPAVCKTLTSRFHSIFPFNAISIIHISDKMSLIESSNNYVTGRTEKRQITSNEHVVYVINLLIIFHVHSLGFTSQNIDMSWFDSPQGLDIFLSFKVSRSAMGPAQHPLQ
jgi:hypothetical protein